MISTFQFSPGAINGFTPKSLFNSSELGLWFDPSDFSTMFQDSAGTTPVTAVGQPVGKILDKSGRSNHATQAVDPAFRPLLGQDANGCYYLDFDGTNSYLVTGNIDFSSVDEMTIWAGLRKLSNTGGTGIFIELSASNANSGIFGMYAPAFNNQADSLGVASKGTSEAFTKITVGTPETTVISLQMDISSPVLKSRKNSAVVATNTNTQGTGSYGNYPLYIGKRGGASFPFKGYMYQLVIRGATSLDSQVAVTEAYVNSKTKAY